MPAGEDSYEFRHSLLAEAVYDDLLPGERVRIHSGYARALGSGAVEGTAAELARHSRLANDLPTALKASIVAGDEAMSVGGPDEAARHFETALELLAAVGPMEGVPDLVSVVVRASDALASSGQGLRAVALLESAVETASATVPPEDLARLETGLADAILLADAPPSPVDHSTVALDLLGGRPSPLLARALAVHARGLMDRGQAEEAARYANEAVRLAEQLDLPRVHTDARTTLVKLADVADDPELAANALLEIERRAAEVGDLHGRLRALVMLGHLVCERGDLVVADESWARAQHIAEESGLPWAPYGFDARFWRALFAFAGGRWDLALELTDLTGLSAPPTAEALLLSVRGAVLAGRQEPEAAEALMKRVRGRWNTDALVPVTLAGPGMEIRAVRGDLDGAWQFHDEVVAAVSEMWSDLFAARVRFGAVLLGLTNDRLTPGDRDMWSARVKELLLGTDAVRARYARARRAQGPEWDAWVARLDAETARFEGRDAQGHWSEAIAAFDAAGLAFEAARSRARSGIVEEMARGRRALEEIGALPRPSAAESATSLTPREQEILALVAEGLSNGDIAKRLYISTKTVSVHVSNILAKLGVSRRTEAAARFLRSAGEDG